jgi:dolichol-phosphate mannosyltransferase
MMDAPIPAPAVAVTSEPAPRQIELSVVIPTFNERSNVTLLLQRLHATLPEICWEAIFVDDDSPDGTATLVKEIAARDPRVRCLRRVSRRGLAGACIDGMLLSAAPYVAIIDADLQHDQTLLPRMLEILQTGAADLVVGSRYSTAGGAVGLSGWRTAISRFATYLARRLFWVSLADPMSGFFMMRRECFDPMAEKLATQGFKILLDIVITGHGRLRITEVSYTFAARAHGRSKLDAHVVMDFAALLLAKMTGGVMTPRFLSFLLVGLSGVSVHLLVLRAMMLVLSVEFTTAQATATLAAMTSNFLLNNALTYRDKQLRGSRLLPGLLAFYAVSSVGAIANIGIASWLFANHPMWWLAGAAGALMSTVWNYSVSTTLVWRVK